MIERHATRATIGMRVEEFSHLMGYRVRSILVVASRYDAFALEEGGQLTELLAREYGNHEINIRHVPRVVAAKSGAEALDLLATSNFDLVVTAARLPDVSVQSFGERVKAQWPSLTLGVLVPHPWDVPLLHGVLEARVADWFLVWQGDVKTLLTMIELEEDARNAEQDVLNGGVRVLIVVEDDVRFLSFMLPRLYSEVTAQTSRLMAEGLNLSHRLLRLQARPKILLARTFEEAWQLWERFGDNTLGIIADVAFPRERRVDPEAGLELARRVKELDPDLGVFLHSSEPTNRALAQAAGVQFSDKGSPALSSDIRDFLLEHCGFGDFVFRAEDGKEIGRAADLRQLLVELERVPETSIEYHAKRNHFSRWLAARTEFELAAIVRPRRVSEFPSLEDLRTFLASAIVSYLHDVQRFTVVDFDAEGFDEFVPFAKIGSGSLGGKGRGLAFVRRLLGEEPLGLEDARVAVPQTVVLTTDVFDGFLEANGLRNIAVESVGMTDEAILDRFREGRFERSIRAKLAGYLQVARGPLAVRSSGALEDSAYRPFSGVYATIMLPNNHPSLDVRLAQLLEAIKAVFASTYMSAARAYLETTPHRIEEERMAVLLQRLVGSQRRDHFYPLVSGVASSYNFYPVGDMKPEDGVVLIAVGLGKTVVEGFEALRFCPRCPQVLPQLSTPKDVLKNAQRKLWALDMRRMDVIPTLDFDAPLLQVDVQALMVEPSAALVASTYIRGSDVIVEGVSKEGVPLITFSRLLKQRVYPLPAVLGQLLRSVHEAMGLPVEIEFALDVDDAASPPVLHVLQVRPMVVEGVPEETVADAEESSEVLVVSESALGHGRLDGLFDIVVVDPGADRARTAEIAAVVERLNSDLRHEGRSYVLIGPGRWGSRDPWLGIPVGWSQISAAGAIVETDFTDFEIEPSQGSHFFHNLTSFGIPFLPVHRSQQNGCVHWPRLRELTAGCATLAGAVRHVRLERPVRVVVNGSSRRGMVLVGQKRVERG